MSQFGNAFSYTSLWKTARVFISSTFRDMHAERDHLVKVALPRLRQWCEERRIHVIDIDLRWGITQEEAESGKAIDICLEEIEGCRPFFICLLGEQYGSLAPVAFIDDKECTPYSITHLEIKRAVFQAHEQGEAMEAFFYLRDSTVLPDPMVISASLKERQAYEATFFQAPSPEGQIDLRERLKSLKYHICEDFAPLDRVRFYKALWDSSARDSATPGVPGRLVNLESFGFQVEADLRRSIEVHYSEHIGNVYRPLTEVTEEQDRQEQFIASRLELHIPDLKLQKLISDYVLDDTQFTCMIWGGPGTGKSAALSYWFIQQVLKNSQKSSSEIKDILVFRAVGASTNITHLPALLASIWMEILERLGNDLIKTLPTLPLDPSDVLVQWANFIQAASEVYAGRIILVVDGLDHIESVTSVTNWIPIRLIPSLKIIISVASDAPTIIQELRQKGVVDIPVALMDEERSRLLIQKLPNLYAKTLDGKQIDALLSNPASQNPLFLTLALRELKLFGSFEKLGEAIAHLPHPNEGEGIDSVLGRMFEMMLARLELDEPPATRAIIRSSLAAISASRQGMSEVDLIKFLVQFHPEIEESKSSATLQVLLRQLRPYLNRRHIQSGVLINFFHRSLSAQVATRYLPNAQERVRYRLMLSTFFEQRPWFRSDCKPDLGKVLELPFLRSSIASEEPRIEYQEELGTLMLNWEFLYAKYLAGLIYELVDDLHYATTLVFELRALKVSLVLIEEAIRRDIGFIEKHKEDYPQALFQCLWNKCWWYDHPAAAAYYEDIAQEDVFNGVMAQWAEKGRNTTARLFPHALWLRQLRPPFTRIGSALSHRITGFSGTLKAISWSSDGRYIVTASVNPAIKIFDAVTTQELLSLQNLGRKVHAVAISPDAQCFAVGLAGSLMEETIKEYSLQTGEYIRTFKGHRVMVHHLEYSEDGTMLFAASGDGTISIWSLSEGVLLQRIDEKKSANSASFLNVNFSLIAGTSTLAWCSRDQFVRIWDWSKGLTVYKFQTEAKGIYDLQVSPNGKFVAFYCGFEGSVGLWVYRIENGALVSCLELDDAYGGPIAWSPDSSLIAMANDHTQKVCIWRLVDGQLIHSSRTHLSVINSLAFSSDGALLATASGFEVHFVKVCMEINSPKLVDHEEIVSVLTYSTDNNLLVSTATPRYSSHENEQANVRIWGGRDVLLKATSNVPEHIEELFRVPGGSYAVTKGRYKNQIYIRIWEWPQMKAVSVQKFAGHKAFLKMLPEGNRFWIYHSNQIEILGCYECALPTGERLRDVPRALAFSNDGCVAVNYCDNKLLVLDVASLSKLGEVNVGGGRLEVACFSSKGDVLVHNDKYDIVVRERYSMRVLHRLPSDGYSATFLQVSEDGRWLTVVSSHRIRVWCLQSGECMVEDEVRSYLDAFTQAPFSNELFPFSTNSELQIRHGASGKNVAIAPEAWHLLCSHSGLNIWSAASKSHICAWRLESLEGESISADFFKNYTAKVFTRAQTPIIAQHGFWTKLSSLLRRFFYKNKR